MGLGEQGSKPEPAYYPPRFQKMRCWDQALSGALLPLDMGAGTSIFHYCSRDLEQGNAVVGFHVETFASHRQLVGVEGWLFLCV